MQTDKLTHTENITDTRPPSGDLGVSEQSSLGGLRGGVCCDASNGGLSPSMVYSYPCGYPSPRKNFPKHEIGSKEPLNTASNKKQLKSLKLDDWVRGVGDGVPTPGLCPASFSVPLLLSPDFPSWPVPSAAGPVPSPGPAPWHAAQAGTCSWRLPPSPRVPAKNRGRACAWRPQGEAWDRAWGPGRPQWEGAHFFLVLRPDHVTHKQKREDNVETCQPHIQS